MSDVGHENEKAGFFATRNAGLAALEPSIEFMGALSARQKAGLGMLLAWCLYVAFALSTDWGDYALVGQPGRYARWIVTRLSTMSFWLSVAALLLWYRKHPVNWRSFCYSFAVTGVIAVLISFSLVSGKANEAVVVGSIAFYAVVSGFLCVTVRKSAVATVVAFPVLGAQLFVDTVAHMFSGVFRLH
jgi:hypothetical protein